MTNQEMTTKFLEAIIRNSKTTPWSNTTPNTADGLKQTMIKQAKMAMDYTKTVNELMKIPTTAEKDY